MEGIGACRANTTNGDRIASVRTQMVLSMLESHAATTATSEGSPDSPKAQGRDPETQLTLRAALAWSPYEYTREFLAADVRAGAVGTVGRRLREARVGSALGMRQA